MTIDQAIARSAESIEQVERQMLRKLETDWLTNHPDIDVDQLDGLLDYQQQLFTEARERFLRETRTELAQWLTGR